MKKLSAAVAIALLAAASPVAAQKSSAQPAQAASGGEERYVGYYYPKPTSTETFDSKIQTVAGVDRTQRVQFVTVISQGTLQSNYRVPYAVFVKGDKADRLIIVGLKS